MVRHWRFELQTPWLKVMCSTDWANGAYGSGRWGRTILPRVKAVYLNRWVIPLYFNEGCLAKLSDVTTYKIIQALYAIVVKIAKYYTDTVS